MRPERSLYECFNARVINSRIRCSKGHSLLAREEDGGLDVSRLADGRPLIFRVCKNCSDFDCMGPPVPPEERGWLNSKGNGLLRL